MKIAVFGAGYVGLVQAAVLADAGHQLWCVDINEDRINRLSEGIVDIYEPGLEDLVADGLKSGRLVFTTNSAVAVENAEVIFIAVGTPLGEDGAADTRSVFSVAETIAKAAQADKVLAIKSTVPVGTTNQVSSLIAIKLAERGVSFTISVVSNPEFLKEGAAVVDCQRPDRIIIGTDDEKAIDKLRELYAPYNRNREKIMVMDACSSELTKYAANCMLATKISFMNEMANIAERVGADIEEVRKGIGADPRIGYHYIYPGCGYGGSCLPKDVRALIKTATNVGYSPELISAVDSVNSRQKKRLFEMLYEYFDSDLKDKVIAIWGLAFKPNTNDMREASSCILIDSLLREGVALRVYDPEALSECRGIYAESAGIVYADSRDEALIGADALAICTECNEFRAPDFSLIASLLKSKLVVDGRNLYDANVVGKYELSYYGIGKGMSVVGN